MSVQFGRWNWEGETLSPAYLERVSASLGPYGPDSNEAYSNSGINILYRAFHTTKESHHEKQPHLSPSGAVITWDGRLDNRADLLRQLGDCLTTTSTDVEIVAAAHEKWSTNCFGKLIGDWALSIWIPAWRSLILAKDPIGTRHLYYSIEHNHVTWSSILDPLVRFAGRTFEIDEEYIAGWLACHPAAHLTPYAGIYAVPPSSSVLIRAGKHTLSEYWHFDPRKRICYRTCAEYEEHFRTVFAQAVRRRLRSDRPILAELSGGMDSCSIVCMADLVMARGQSECTGLDTVSWDDDLDLEERYYFTKVEQKRKSAGYHIKLCSAKRPEDSTVDSRQSFLSEFESDRFAATPNSHSALWPEFFTQYATYMKSREYRVTLSGIAGEDPTGGYVPTPTPELQNLLVRGRFLRLARQTNAWAVKTGKPRLLLLWKALRGFSTYSITYPGPPKDMCPPSWLQPSFVRRTYAALHWYPSKLRLFGGLPSFQYQLHLLNHERRYLAALDLWPEMLREIRYPYLDRDLLEFACAIPREQMVGVGKRRFLMKRALAGIVPNEIIDRKRRATVNHKPGNDISTELTNLIEVGQQMISTSMGIVDPSLFARALQTPCRSEEISFDSLKRTLILESWLHHIGTQGVVAMATKRAIDGTMESKRPQPRVQFKSSAS